MKKLTSSVGGFLVLISGAITWIFMMLWLTQWWGILGFLASLVFTPGVVIFPIVFWVVENQFPTNYFIAWGVGIVGLVIMAASDK